MDTDHLVSVAPHYVAMIILAYIAIAIVGAIVGTLEFIPRIIIVTVVVFAYRPVVMHLGIGPDAWEQ